MTSPPNTSAAKAWAEESAAWSTVSNGPALNPKPETRNSKLLLSHANHRGDVIARSDDNCSLTSFALYEAYGTRPYEWGTDPDRQKANTKEEESDLGLLNEGMRYRDLETGTFLTRDPLGYGDGPNLYCYVHCNPITDFDAVGLFSWKRLGAAIRDTFVDGAQFAIGAATGYIEGVTGVSAAHGPYTTAEMAGRSAGRGAAMATGLALQGKGGADTAMGLAVMGAGISAAPLAAAAGPETAGISLAVDGAVVLEGAAQAAVGVAEVTVGTMIVNNSQSLEPLQMEGSQAPGSGTHRSGPEQGQRTGAEPNSKWTQTTKDGKRAFKIQFTMVTEILLVR